MNIRTPLTPDRWTLKVYQGDAIEVATPDGIETDFICGIELIDNRNGGRWYYPCHYSGSWKCIEDEETGQQFDIFYTGRQQAEEMINTIKEHGSVNLNNWKVLD